MVRAMGWRAAGAAVVLVVLPAIVSAQTGTRVPLEQMRELREMRGVVIQRVGPLGVDTIRSDSNVRIRAGEILVATPPAAAPAEPGAQEPAPQGEQHVDVPVPIIAATESGARILYVTVQTGGGLTYLPSERAFVGEVRIGLEDAEQPLGRFELTSPIVLQLVPHSGRVEPELFRLAHTQVPLQIIRVVDPAPADTVVLIRVLYPNQQPMTIHVPVRRTPLVITPQRARISGFGLEKAQFSVALPSALSVDSLEIGFSSTMQPEASSAFAAAGRPARLRIQSRGLGTDTVRATGPHYVEAGVAVIVYALPWGFLGASLLGGALGVFIRESTRKQRAGTKRNWLATALAGMAVGFLIAVGYAVGVNLLSIAVTGPPVEAVILLVAGLGAFLGAPALKAAVMRG